MRLLRPWIQRFPIPSNPSGNGAKDDVLEGEPPAPRARKQRPMANQSSSSEGSEDEWLMPF